VDQTPVWSDGVVVNGGEVHTGLSSVVQRVVRCGGVSGTEDEVFSCGSVS